MNFSKINLSKIIHPSIENKINLKNTRTKKLLLMIGFRSNLDHLSSGSCNNVCLPFLCMCVNAISLVESHLEPKKTISFFLKEKGAFI